MNSRLCAIFSLAFFLVSLLAHPRIAYAATVAVSGKAAILNATDSYLNFTLNNSNVVINDSTGAFSGYAWLDDIGWVAFGTFDNDEGPVSLNLISGEVTGKAKVVNTGEFLYFSTNSSNVTVELATGMFSGHVWSGDVGWIDFADTGVSSASFQSAPTSSAQSDIAASSTHSSSSDSGCTLPKLVSKSDLFQINTTKNSAKLLFSPLADTSDFYISFSEKPNAEQHGEQVALIREGVQSHTIYQLRPNTVYYAKVRGQKGCSSGDWSNSMKFKTDSRVYYKNTPISNKIASVIKRITNTVASQPTQVSQGNTAPSSSPVPDTKKKCILWWCW